LLGEFGLRLAINQHPFKKIGGIILCILLPLSLLFLNLLVTHYRSAVVVMSDNAAILALESFANSPFSLNDVEAWMLFLFGMLFATIATIDFWKMDDHYAGYGKIDRHHKEKMNDYEETRVHLLQGLQEIRDHALIKLEGELIKIRDRCGEMQSILSSQQRIKILYLDHLEHLESNCNILLKYYRNLSKKTANPTGYLGRQWKIAKALPLDNKVDFGSILQAFQIESEGAQMEYAGCVEVINKKYSETFASC
jgi:hypothetical protein